MKKILAVLLALAMICALGVTAFADDAVAPKDGGSKLTFTTGGEAGTYYGFGSVLAQKVSDVTSTNVTAITSGGSAANIDAIDIGDAQLGFSQSDVLAYAYAGTRSFEEIGAITNFSIVAPLYMEQVQIVTLNPDIKTVADLKGKAVSIGAAGSGVQRGSSAGRPDRRGLRRRRRPHHRHHLPRSQQERVPGQPG